jgi:hypothetical protein
MEVDRIDGPCGVLRKMAELDFDGNFAIVPPGETVGEGHFS